ncbi:unnamed protein product [Haemonchus placei]|uniref:ANF_receptor domain-containing protein n=1 Tax=Haemonchus placei TaxID=6290 RepID=A0A158QNQ0_HAEPC|nr:unnamed protein product [Haemonchus placei]
MAVCQVVDRNRAPLIGSIISSVLSGFETMNLPKKKEIPLSSVGHNYLPSNASNAGLFLFMRAIWTGYIPSSSGSSISIPSSNSRSTIARHADAQAICARVLPFLSLPVISAFRSSRSCTDDKWFLWIACASAVQP